MLAETAPDLGRAFLEEEIEKPEADESKASTPQTAK
jgi:hypothetical protein